MQFRTYIIFSCSSSETIFRSNSEFLFQFHDNINDVNSKRFVQEKKVRIDNIITLSHLRTYTSVIIIMVVMMTMMMTMKMMMTRS